MTHMSSLLNLLQFIKIYDTSNFILENAMIG